MTILGRLDYRGFALRLKYVLILAIGASIAYVFIYSAAMGNRFSSYGGGCSGPEMTLQNSKINHFFTPSKPVICSNDTNWIKVLNGSIVFANEATSKHGNFTCDIEQFWRNDDFTTTSKVFHDITNNTKMKSDFFHVNCTSQSSNASYRNIHAGIVRATAKALPTAKSPGFNVVMVGFDSVSRLTFMRKMNQSYKYLNEQLGAIVLKRYNIIGDGTPQALIPILTGKTEFELPDTRKRKPNAKFCNVYPFVWNNYSTAGYVTLYAEDSSDVGTFVYRLKGFKEQPVDHYMRTFYIHAVKEEKYHRRYCLGSEHLVTVHYDYVRHMFDAYPDRLKFAFAFSDISHDDHNNLDIADEPFLMWLRHFKNSGWLENTVLIVMSDHGARYKEVRATEDGKMEERYPFFSFILPNRFKDTYPEATRNLLINTERLSTPFDIYATLLALITGVTAGNGSVEERSISLFKEIPFGRTCRHANIEPHWCTCLQWVPISVDNPKIAVAVDTVIKAINAETHEFRADCVPLDLRSVDKAFLLMPDKGLLNYEWAKDTDGFVGNFVEGFTKVAHFTYQVVFTTKPGGNIYETSVVVDASTGAVTVDLRNLGVLNWYSPNGFCVKDKDIMKERYCYCRSKVNKP